MYQLRYVTWEGIERDLSVTSECLWPASGTYVWVASGVLLVRLRRGLGLAAQYLSCTYIWLGFEDAFEGPVMLFAETSRTIGVTYPSIGRSFFDDGTFLEDCTFH